MMPTVDQLVSAGIPEFIAGYVYYIAIPIGILYLLILGLEQIGKLWNRLTMPPEWVEEHEKDRLDADGREG